MTIQFNHTIVHARDSHASAVFLAEILGLAAPVPFGPFRVVQADNGVSLDFQQTAAPVTPQHYAFLIGEAERRMLLPEAGWRYRYVADPRQAIAVAKEFQPTVILRLTRSLKRLFCLVETLRRRYCFFLNAFFTAVPLPANRSACSATTTRGFPGRPNRRK